LRFLPLFTISSAFTEAFLDVISCSCDRISLRSSGSVDNHAAFSAAAVSSAALFHLFSGLAISSQSLRVFSASNLLKAVSASFNFAANPTLAGLLSSAKTLR